MPTLKDLRKAVKNVLSNNNKTVRKGLDLNRMTRERAYEAYIFSLVVSAVRDAGGNVIIKGINSGRNPKKIIFRGSPGHMGSNKKDFVYAVCELNGRMFEVHVGVQYIGTSGALHEVDVSIFDHDKAEDIRRRSKQNIILPSSKNLRAAIECKCYDSALGVSLGRTFVGLVSDLGGLRIKSFVTNGKSSGLADYFSKSDRPQPFFVLSTLKPHVTAHRFVKNLEQELRKWCSVI